MSNLLGIERALINVLLLFTIECGTGSMKQLLLTILTKPQLWSRLYWDIHQPSTTRLDVELKDFCQPAESAFDLDPCLLFLFPAAVFVRNEESLEVIYLPY